MNRRIISLLAFFSVFVSSLLLQPAKIVYAQGNGVETTIMGIFMYNQGFRYFELGLGSATAVVLLGISFIIIGVVLITKS